MSGVGGEARLKNIPNRKNMQERGRKEGLAKDRGTKDWRMVTVLTEVEDEKMCVL